jgi:hypothetical protein
VQAAALLVDVREHRDAQALAFDAPGVIHIPVIGKRFSAFDKEQEP